LNLLELVLKIISKAVTNFELVEDPQLFLDKNIHINQINTEEIFLCIVFKNYFEIYIIDYNVLAIFQNRMTSQHGKDQFQLHIPYREIKERCLYSKKIL